MFNIIAKEEAILSYWAEKGINQKVKKKNTGGKKFYFLDGPPYVSGDLHAGQMWVKTVKDITLRYRRYAGFDVWDRAGYDVHGLPIENKVEKQLHVSSKGEIESKIGVENFVKKCREYADGYMGRMDKDFIRYGISLDFSNPYLAYRNEFIETSWAITKRIFEKGAMYRGKKTTAFCIHCGTALAQGSTEVEYREAEDPSIYFLLKADRAASKPKASIPEDSYLLVWTTTPWTLPANVSVAANPDELYVLVESNSKNIILAKKRLEDVFATLNQSFVVKAEFYGRELEGFRYASPLEDKIPEQRALGRYHRVVFSGELVSMLEGSGLVHIAPGHGIEDYNIARKEKLKVFSPVDQNGEYTKEAGEYKGVHVPGEANKVIMDALDRAGVLAWRGTIRHSYPHCWRCDNKLIYIATEQWFFNIQKVKKKLIRENRKVAWHPGEAAAWHENILLNSPDWCISRQRYWGIPIPVWTCAGCGALGVIGSISELRERATDAKAVDLLTDMHRPHIDSIKLRCTSCGGEMSRVPDVMDVWFDASTTFRTCMDEENFKRMFPVDYIIEGKDQLRGWFSYLLKLSVLAYGRSPYRAVGVDGMLLDEKGMAMHKKTGNYVSLDELISKYGADTFRLWCADHTPWLDLNFNTTELNEATKLITILYNVSNLLSEYQAALGYRPKLRSRINPKRLDYEEAWILSRLESTVAESGAFYSNYEGYMAAHVLRKFITEDLSRFYLKSAKRNMLSGRRSKAKTTIDVINYVLYKAVVAISPITPFLSESIYLDRYGGKESIFLEDWPRANRRAINKTLEGEMDIVRDSITALLNCRERAGISLRVPISSAVIEVKDGSSLEVLQRLSYLIEEYVNAKRVELKVGKASRLKIIPVFSKIGPEFRGDSAEVVEALRAADVDEVVRAVQSDGHYQLHTNKGAFDIKPAHFTVTEAARADEASAFKFGSVSIDTNITKELKNEAFVREFERAVQLIRKEMGLSKVDRIRLGFEASPEHSAVIKENSARILMNTNSSKLREGIEPNAQHRVVEIGGASIKVSVSRQ